MIFRVYVTHWGLKIICESEPDGLRNMRKVNSNKEATIFSYKSSATLFPITSVGFFEIFGLLERTLFCSPLLVAEASTTRDCFQFDVAGEYNFSYLESTAAHNIHTHTHTYSQTTSGNRLRTWAVPVRDRVLLAQAVTSGRRQLCLNLLCAAMKEIYPVKSWSKQINSKMSLPFYFH